MKKINNSRRKLIVSLGVVTAGAMLVSNKVLATAARTKTAAASKTKATKVNNAGSRTLYIKAVYLNETLRVTYFDGKNYVAKALEQLNHLCRDRRNGQKIKIDSKVFDILHRVQKKHNDRLISIISGYRSPTTNNILNKTTTGVAQKSLHMKGQAIDFYIDGVELKEVLRTSLSLNKGGVGFYPGSNFVHVDTGGVRHWPRSTVAKALSSGNVKKNT